MKKLIPTFIGMLAMPLLMAQVLIPAGSTWKYLDDGTDQGTAWRNLSFNDNAWASGNAQLGYGDGDETTVISYGNSSSNKHICYYFRKTFTVSNPAANTGIKISLLRDDGAVVYINGTEVARSNMPSGTITYQTPAASTVAGAAEDVFYEYSVPSSVLNTGQNVIAVEVHQRSHSSSDVSFDLQLEFAALDYYRKRPYVLYPGNNDEMMVMWQLTSTQPCTLAYGTDTTYSIDTLTTTEYGNDHQHKAVLTGLTPGQRYYYKVNVGNTPAQKGSFNAGPYDTTQNITVFAYGDTRSYPHLHDSVAKRIMLDITQNNRAHTFIINSGDLVSNGDDEASWDAEFFNKQNTHILDMLANLPYLTALGNHEGQGILFAKYFPYPMFVSSRYYYSFDYGPIHVIVIDQETSYSQGSMQYNWIVNDLASSNKPWKIAVFHKPGWSAGVHSNSSTVQNVLQPLFEQYNVKLVLTGHNHYYARAVVNGVHHITTGGGGAPLYTPSSSYPNIVTVDQSNHYCRIEITGNVLHCYAIRSNGSPIEDFTLSSPTGLHTASSEPKWTAYSKNGRIVIPTSGIESGQIEIYDADGKKLAQQRITGKEASFSVPKAGIYFVRLIHRGKLTVTKVAVPN